MPDDPETNSATARVWKRGSTFNAVKRARQFPDDFIAKGEEIMWCTLFAVPISDDDDDDLWESKIKRNRQLQEEWGRYTRIEKANVQCCKDINTFWSQRGGLLPAAVEPFLWFPLSSAAVERSFSLAGLIDAPNRQRMGERVREACVTMFFNGDVEQRFTKD